MSTAPHGTFRFSESGIHFTVEFQHGQKWVSCAVVFTWESLGKMQDQKLGMNQVMAKVVSRTIAMLEDSNG